MNLKDRFEGAIFGLAIGDALGRPTEFYNSLEAIRAKFGPDGVTDLEPDWHPAGTYTDDTQMSLAVARALVFTAGQPLEALMRVMGEQFVAWNLSPQNDRAPGHTCRAGCENREKGVDWQHAGVAESKGCGSAMRTAPIGLSFYDDEPRLIEVARASSLPTHGHPTALAAAAAAALLVAWVVRGDAPDEFPKRLLTEMNRMPGAEEVADLVRRIPDVLDKSPAKVLREGVLGESWVGEEAVASALFCFCRSPGDYRKTVLTAANTVGDSDSIACIAGGISGAHNGIDAIPEKWRREIEDAAGLSEIAAGLLYARSRRQETPEA